MLNSETIVIIKEQQIRIEKGVEIPYVKTHTELWL